MKIALIGYGKLGKAIEEMAIKRGHEIVLRVTKANAHSYELTGCDVAIECTNPAAVLGNINRCLMANIPVVVGSTGWYDQFDIVKKNVDAHHGSLLYATNFSVGVHLFWEACRSLATMMDKFKNYDVRITEIHHTAKKDAPSGTAITTAEILVEELATKNQWLLTNERVVNKEHIIGIEALREGDVKGTHIVTFESKVDRIELKHEALNREGFASGALLAAEFLQSKKGVYSMRDVMKDYQS